MQCKSTCDQGESISKPEVFEKMNYFCGMKRRPCFTLLFFCAILIICCKQELKKTEPVVYEEDPHSFSKPSITNVNHLDLNLKVNFETRNMEGIACYDLGQNQGNELILDNMGLNIQDIQIIQDGNTSTASFQIEPKDSILGAAIKIELKPSTQKVCIHYSTGNYSKALQWLPKEQTRSKEYPFLFTQSQSIFARSWIPCPDGPGMRFTYHAKVQVPKGMMAVMSASNVQQKNKDGIYEFNMELPIPAYLLALAVGDFSFKKIGERTGVYAEPELLDQAAVEFTDLERMLTTAENLYGPYPWNRYDVIVLPSSFPFGGMENPRMTFLTPSVIVGDKSLTSLLAHELAHSWSGNLVTNASWNDFWLNEGFTTYFESRIMESLYGKEYADMLSILGLQDLKKTMDEMGPDNPLTKLKLDLKNRDPEDAMSDIAYEKGKALLRFLEERFGRQQFDAFLKTYFEHFKFKSNTSEGFFQFVEQQLIKDQPGLTDTVKQWIFNTGWIAYKPGYDDLKFKQIDSELASFLKHSNFDSLKTAKWSTHEWIYFIRSLPMDKNTERCKSLDARYYLYARNAEIQCAWFEYAIKNNYGLQLFIPINHFLMKTGRRKYLLPIYKAMKENQMEQAALSIFDMAKAGYHPIALESVQELLQGKN